MTSTDGIIAHINVDASVGEALYAMTRQLGLTYAVHEKFVFVSTPELVGELAPTGGAAAKDPGRPAIVPGGSSNTSTQPTFGYAPAN